jgi:hypothetical protein
MRHLGAENAGGEQRKLLLLMQCIIRSISTRERGDGCVHNDGAQHDDGGQLALVIALRVLMRGRELL